MFADEMRRAVEVAPRVRLADLAAAVWKGFACGAVSEEDAQQLAELIEVRKTVTASVLQSLPSKRSQGPRPRSPVSIERRRRWAGSGWLPPQLHAQFTAAESAVLAVVACEVMRTGLCSLSIAAIAGMAGTGRTLVKRAIGEARRLGVLQVEVRPITKWRNATNILSITSPEWRSWLSRRAKGVGSRQRPDTITSLSSTSSSASAVARDRALRVEGGTDNALLRARGLAIRRKSTAGHLRGPWSEFQRRPV